MIKFLKACPTQVSIEITVHHNGKPYIYEFTVECGQEHVADMLIETLEKQFRERIEKIREREYTWGYKNGRGKQSKATFFANNMNYLP